MTTWEAGALAEDIAFAHERESVAPGLKGRVRLVRDQHGLGYDIESVNEENGKADFKAIEVKAWSKEGHFLISKHEVEVLRRLGRSGWIYLVDITRRRIVKRINDPFGSSNLQLEPTAFRCLF